jgi:hypothetical protein
MKSSKIYIQDGGILHALLQQGSVEDHKKWFPVWCGSGT